MKCYFNYLDFWSETSSKPKNLIEKVKKKIAKTNIDTQVFRKQHSTSEFYLTENIPSMMFGQFFSESCTSKKKKNAILSK